MIYVFTSLQSMAQALRRMGENATAGPATATSMSVRAGWNAAAQVVESARLADLPVAEEYALEYSSAQSVAAVHIWASMQRHRGDPCWEYVQQEHTPCETRR